MGTVVVDEVGALLRAGVEAFRPGNLVGLSSADTIRLVRLAEQHRHQLAAVDAWLLTELGERALTGEIGTTSPVDVLVTECRVTAAAARARVRVAGDLGSRRTLSGAVLEPVFAETAAALGEGVISPAAVRVIRAMVRRIPRHLAAVAAPAAEKYLVYAAQHLDVRALDVEAAELLARIDPDGCEPREDEVERKRHFTMRKLSNGSSEGSYRFDAETTALYEAIFDALAAPAPAKNENGTVLHRDERTGGQRRHDAMRELAQRVMRSGTLPSTGGTPTTILVRVNLTDLQGYLGATSKADFMTGAGFGGPSASAADRDAVNDVLSGSGGDCGSGDTHSHSGVAQTQHGGLMSVRMMMHLACEANIVPVVLDDLGGVLAYGRGRRSGSPGQRYALTIRDRGCVFPGCDRPASWTEVHHIQEWVNDGLTDIDNMCLLCSHHHRTFEADGWAVEMFQGRPRWIPPSWLDPERKPRRNTAHHLDDLSFTVPS